MTHVTCRLTAQNLDQLRNPTLGSQGWATYTTLLQLHPFNSLFSRTTWVSRYQKGKTSLDLNEARDDWVFGWQWHQLDDSANNLHLATDR